MTSSVIEPAKTGAGGDGSCECGFDPTRFDPPTILATLRAIPARFRRALAFNLADGDPEAILLSAPRPREWSGLEHAAHVRDVLHAFESRIRRLADRDGMGVAPIPQVPPTGVREQGLAVVLTSLAGNADRLARTLGNLAPTCGTAPGCVTAS